MIGERWLRPGIIAGYHMADVNDFSGNSHTLTNYNTVSFSSDKFGKCANFGNPNTNKYLYHSDGFSANIGNACGISFLLSLSAAPSSGAMIGLVEWRSGKYIYLLYQNSSGTMKFYLNHCENVYNPTYTIPLNQWILIDINHDGSFIYLYVNGSLIGSTASGTNDGGTSYLNVGRDWAARYMSGFIDELVFFNVSRTPQEIRNYYRFIKYGE